MTYSIEQKQMIRGIAELILGDLKFFKSKKLFNKDDIIMLFPAMQEFLDYAYSNECSRSTVRTKIASIKDNSIRGILESTAEHIYDIKVEHILHDLTDTLSNVQYEVRKLNEALCGRKVVITSDYNGQPYGISKKSLKGKTATIRRFYVDIDVKGEYYFALFLEEYLVGIKWSEVELLSDE